ncbi:Uncharacterised protein [uncultured Ruminococcus sp.]|uniref:hypothetical protein n=1 Tax=Massiliimalia timonensis TaxID=1987501 RepID=UPI00082203E2|nr:hypothetical protein [Massiliimalia timonensis]MBS7175644.1 hypothetical protein [Clostridiales bacterium]SCG96838.1 Uncharacterised protein [uncultured Clostridium sp.]SCH92850.1 Uncharacterised protein [uncultured Ruminococcus sp.]
MSLANQDIKNEIRGAGLYLWQIADKLGMNDGNFSRKLRRELSTEDKKRIREIIKELREGN